MYISISHGFRFQNICGTDTIHYTIILYCSLQNTVSILQYIFHFYYYYYLFKKKKIGEGGGRIIFKTNFNN